MITALVLVLGSLVVGSVVFDKLTIHQLRKQVSATTAALLEASGEKRAAAAVSDKPPAPKAEPVHPQHRPRQIGMTQRP